MDSVLLLFISVSVSAVLALLLRRAAGKAPKLPPGPPAVPLLGNLLWLRRGTFRDIEPLLQSLHAKHGPIVTLRLGSRPSIFIADRALAHKALVEHGAAFSDRPAPLPATRFLSSNQHSISSAAYGPLWRLLRRNLTSEILHPSRVKLYGPGRSWVLGILTHHLRAADGPVVLVERFQFAMFCLLVLMCFGEKLDEKAIRDIETAQRQLLLYAGRLNVFAFIPRLAKYLFRRRWMTMLEMRGRQAELYLPLIEARRAHKLKPVETPKERYVYSYVDSLLDIELPDEGGRRLTDDEMVTLCSEFLNGGTDTTSTALQWIMARLVKHRDVQERLAAEIASVVGGGGGEVREEELQRMPYLKAVVLEGLRLHPPGHLVLPHAVTEEVTIEGYTMPKGASINFLVAAMNRDGTAWEEPMEFRPERFMAVRAVDITGTKEIKMMPFGAGRRICPAHGLAMLHLEYFVANLVNQFEWTTVAGEDVDFTEKSEFTTVMKNPLRACLISRKKNVT